MGDKPSDLDAAEAAGIQGLSFQDGLFQTFVRQALSLDQT
ncbi:hypothetical protein [Bradyrhizobium sp. U531]